MTNPQGPTTWLYDEFRQVGQDFADAGQVADYDRRQGDRDSANDALLSSLGVRAGQVVVDIGTGTGSLARAAARRGAKVHAVDVSQAMLRRARERAEAEGLLDIAFHHAGFLGFDLPAGSADWAFSQMALHHLPDFWKQTALLRIAAFLRPGGKLYLSDVIFSFEPGTYLSVVEAWIAAVAKGDGASWSRSDFETHVREEHSTYAWIVEGMLQRAGFAIDKADYELGAYASYLCSKTA